MDINVKYLIEQFPGFKVLAGEGGLNKKVTTVSVMDAPDISNWMKGGEFLITTGYVMKDNPSNFKSLIVKSNDNKTAAMGIKLGRFIEELPQKVKDTANELNFPIVYIPTEYAFTDIINPVLSIVVNAQAKKLMTSEKINKTFTHLVMEGKGMKDIINELYSILGRSIYFVDLIFNRKYRKGGSSNFEQDTKILNYENLIDKYYNYLILMDNNHYGYIIIDEDKEGVAVTDLDKIAIQHASTVIILTIQKNISRQQIAQKYRGEFIQDLIVNNIKTVEEVNNRAKLYGWRIEKGLVCLVVDIDDFKKKFIYLEQTEGLEQKRDKVFYLVIDKMKNSFYQCLYTTYSDSIVFLIEPDIQPIEDFFNKLKRIAKEIREEVKDNNKFTLTVGIGNYKESIMKSFISYREAQEAVKIGRIMNKKDETYIYSELGVYNILYKFAFEEDASNFYSENLHKLIKYDNENNAEYLNTLDCLIGNDWNLKQTSKELFIHYNTMKYRYNKICEILGLHLNNRDNKFKIELCLKIMNIGKQDPLYKKTNK